MWRAVAVSMIASAAMGAGAHRYWSMSHNAAQQQRADRACLMAVAQASGLLKKKKPKLVYGPVLVHSVVGPASTR